MSVLGYKGIYEPMQNRHAVKQVQQIYHAEEDGEEKDSSPSSQTSEEAVQRKRDAFAQLKAGNPDTIGWIQIPNTVVDYPVMQSSKDNPELYLRHGYDKKYTQYGCIFLDANCTPAQEMKNLTLYWHNMIDFDLEGVEGKWKVFSVFKINTLPEQGEIFDYAQPDFEDDEAFTAFIEEMRSRSILNLPVDVNADDQLLTLSTCSYEFEEFRTVVVARRVREGEDATVDLDKAAYNPSPVYPDCWVQKYGS